MSAFNLRKKIVFLCSIFGILFFVENLVFAEDKIEQSDENFSVFEKAKKSGKEFNQIKKESDKIFLLPDFEYSSDVKNFIFSEEDLKSAYVAEVLFYVKKSELIEKSSAQDKSKIDTSVNAVSKIMRSVSKMKGMQYYSNSKKRYETLYLDSFRVENPENLTPLEDFTKGSADGLTSYIFQNENSFGKAVYKANYCQNQNSVTIKMANVIPLCYGKFEAVKTDDCKVAISVIDDGDGYFIYLAMNVDYVRFPFIEGKLNKSFAARMDAICNWFILQF